MRSNIVRRRFLKVLPVAAASIGLTVRSVRSQQPQGNDTLVAFFSRTGNTKVIASQIARAKTAVIFEIVPSADYPEDYEKTVAQARSETYTGFLPDLERTLAGFLPVSHGLSGIPDLRDDCSASHSVVSRQARHVREGPAPLHHTWRSRPRRQSRYRQIACARRGRSACILNRSGPRETNAGASDRMVEGLGHCQPAYA